MNRLQKKCFIASAGLHLLLGLILLFGSAFISDKSKSDEIAPIDFIPTIVIDKAFAGGGDQGSRPPPAAPPVREVAPAIPKVEPKPEPKIEPIKVREPDPPKDPVKPPKEVVESFEPRKEPKRHTPEVTTKAVSRNSDTKTDTKKKQPKQPSESDSHAEEVAAAKHQKEVAALIGETANTLRNERSSGTKISINPGPGGGGPAYAGYEMVLQKIYQGRYDEALTVSSDVGDARATVEVSVTIQRNGTVISSRIVNPSGISGLDRLVKGVLGRVNSVPAFPETSKDSERTFNIIFELKPKRGTG